MSSAHLAPVSEPPLEWEKLTSDELDGLDRQLPVVVPIGLVESHGPALTLGFDNESAEHFARIACVRGGGLLMPPLRYGFADEFRDYPGTVGLSMDTLGHVIADVCVQIRRHGFYKIIFLSGHGANVDAARLGFERAWATHRDLRLACWSWWSVIDLAIHHADEVETSFALLLGSPVYLARARDGEFRKPWHKVRSRYEFQPHSGGVNGSPSRARAELVAADYDRVVEKLTGLIEEARADTAVGADADPGLVSGEPR